MADHNSRVVIDIDTTKVKSGLQDINNHLKDVSNNTKILERDLKSVSKINLNKLQTSVNQTRKAFTQLNNTVTKTNSIFKTLDVSSNKLSNNLQKCSRQTTTLVSDLNKLGSSKVDVDTTQLHDGLKEVSKTTKSTTEDVEKLSNTKIKDNTDDLQDGMREVRELGNRAQKEISKLDNKQLKDITTEMNKGLIRTTKSAQQLGNAITGLGNKFTQSFQTTGTAMLAVSALGYNMNTFIQDSIGLYGALDSTTREMTYQFSQLDNSMIDTTMSFSEFNSIGGEVGSMFDQLSDKAGVTAFSTQETYDAMLELSKAGMSVETSFGIVSNSMIAADMNGLALDSTIHAMVGTLNAFGFDLANSANAGEVMSTSLSTLQEVADATNSDLSDLTKGMEYLAPVASQAGVSFEESAVLLGFLGNAGLEAEKGARVLASGLLNLVSPTAEAQESLDALGITIHETDGEMRPIVDILKEFDSALAGATDQEKAMHLETIFGKTAIKSWGAIINQETGSMEELLAALEPTTAGLDYLNQKFLETTFGVASEDLNKYNQEMKNLQSSMVDMAYTVDQETGKYMTEFGQIIEDNTDILIRGGASFDEFGNIVDHSGKVLLDSSKAVDEFGNTTVEGQKTLDHYNETMSGTTLNAQIMAFELEEAKAQAELMNDAFLTLAETNPAKYFELLTEQITDFKTQVGGSLAGFSAVPISKFIDTLTSSLQVLKDGLDELYPSLDLSSKSLEQFGADITAIGILLVTFTTALMMSVYMVTILGAAVVGMGVIFAGVVAIQNVSDQLLTMSEIISNFLVPTIDTLVKIFNLALVPAMEVLVLGVNDFIISLQVLGSSINNLLFGKMISDMNNASNSTDELRTGIEILEQTFTNMASGISIGLQNMSRYTNDFVNNYGTSLILLFEELSKTWEILVGSALPGVLNGILIVTGEMIPILESLLEGFNNIIASLSPEAWTTLGIAIGTVTVAVTGLSIALKGLMAYNGIKKSITGITKGLGLVNTTSAKTTTALSLTTKSTSALSRGFIALGTTMSAYILPALGVIAVVGALGITFYALGKQFGVIATDMRSESQKLNDQLEADFKNGLISVEEFDEGMVKSAEMRAEEISKANEKMYKNGDLEASEYNNRVKALEGELTTDISEQHKLRHEDLKKQLELNEIEDEDYTKAVQELNSETTKAYQDEYDLRKQALQDMYDEGIIDASEYYDDVLELNAAHTENMSEFEQLKMDEVTYRHEQGLIEEEEYNQLIWAMQDEDYNKFKINYDKKKEVEKKAYTDGKQSYESYSNDIAKIREKETIEFEKMHSKQLSDLEEAHANGEIEEEIYQEKRKTLAESTKDFYNEKYIEDLDNLEEAHANGLISEYEYQTDKLKLQQGNVDNMIKAEDERYKSEVIAAEGNKTKLAELEYEHIQNVESIKREGLTAELQVLKDREEQGIELSQAELDRKIELENDLAEINTNSRKEEMLAYELMARQKGEIDLEAQEKHLSNAQQSIDDELNAQVLAGNKLVDQQELTLQEMEATQLTYQKLAVESTKKKDNELLQSTIDLNKEMIDAGAENSEELIAQNEILNEQLQANAVDNAEILRATASVTKDQLIAYDQEFGTSFVKTLENNGFVFDEKTGEMKTSYGVTVSEMNTQELEALVARLSGEEVVEGQYATLIAGMDAQDIQALVAKLTGEEVAIGEYMTLIANMDAQDIQALIAKLDGEERVEMSFEGLIARLDSKEIEPLESELSGEKRTEGEYDSLIAIMDGKPDPVIEAQVETQKAKNDFESFLAGISGRSVFVNTETSSSGGGSNSSSSRGLAAFTTPQSNSFSQGINTFSNNMLAMATPTTGMAGIGNGYGGANYTSNTYNNSTNDNRTININVATDTDRDKILRKFTGR